MKKRQKTLLMLGDSLVEWGDWSSLLPEVTVINRGVAGEQVEELSARVAAEIAALEEPDHILILSGTNNLLMNNTWFPAIFTSMLPRIQMLCPASTITLNSLMPMSLNNRLMKGLAEINEELCSVTRESNCLFLDMTGPFTEQCLPITRPCFLDDGVHLASRGYQVWAQAIARHIESLQLIQ